MIDVAFKSGASGVAPIQGLHIEVIRAIVVAAGVWDNHNISYPFTVTALNDGKHSDRSRHYLGCAVDLRTWADSSGQQLSTPIREALALSLRQRLGPDFDVVVESTHIHLEYDPK